MPQKGMLIFPFRDDAGRFVQFQRVKTGISQGHRQNRSLLKSWIGNFGKSWTDLGQRAAETYIYSLTYCGNGICLAGSAPTGKIFRSTRL